MRLTPSPVKAKHPALSTRHPWKSFDQVTGAVLTGQRKPAKASSTLRARSPSERLTGNVAGICRQRRQPWNIPRAASSVQ